MDKSNGIIQNDKNYIPIGYNCFKSLHKNLGE